MRQNSHLEFSFELHWMTNSHQIFIKKTSSKCSRANAEMQFKAAFWVNKLQKVQANFSSSIFKSEKHSSGQSTAHESRPKCSRSLVHAKNRFLISFSFLSRCTFYFFERFEFISLQSTAIGKSFIKHRACRIMRWWKAVCVWKCASMFHHQSVDFFPSWIERAREREKIFWLMLDCFMLHLLNVACSLGFMRLWKCCLYNFDAFVKHFGIFSMSKQS